MGHTCPLANPRNTFSEVVETREINHALEPFINLLGTCNPQAPVFQMCPKYTIVEFMQDVWCEGGKNVAMWKFCPERSINLTKTIRIKGTCQFSTCMPVQDMKSSVRHVCLGQYIVTKLMNMHQALGTPVLFATGHPAFLRMVSNKIARMGYTWHMNPSAQTMSRPEWPAEMSALKIWPMQ